MEDKSINAGKVGLTMGGDWKSSESYEKLTCVSHNGRSWAAKKNVSAGVEPSEANSAFWQLMSDRGVQGIQGPVGPQGNSAFDGTGVEIVNNLTQGGESAVLSAEQGKVLKTELTELESKVDVLFADYFNPNDKAFGTIKTNGSVLVDAASSAVYQYIDDNAKEGDAYLVHGYGAGSYQLWAFADASGNILSKSGIGEVDGREGVIAVAPNGTTKAIFSCYTNYANLFLVQKNDAALKKSMEAMKEAEDAKSKADYILPQLWERKDFANVGKYNTSGSTLVSASLSVYQYVDDTAKEGDYYLVYGYGAGSGRLWAFADTNGNILSKSVGDLNQTETPAFVVAPKGTTRAVFSAYLNDAYKLLVIKNGVYDKMMYGKAEDSFDSILKNKKITWCGDSIMAAIRVSANQRLPQIIDSLVGSQSENIASDGSLFYDETWYTGAARSILWQVKQASADSDYIIVQGGVNGVNITDSSAQNYAPYGEMTDSYTSDFDTKSQIGCLEEICKYLVKNYAGKKVGFIITYQIGGSYREYLSYWKTKIDKFLPVLEKWGIPYLDWRETGINLAANAEGYGIDSFSSYQEFDASKSYKVDESVIYNGKLYKANENISAGAFDASKWTLTSNTRYDNWHCNAEAYRILAYKTAKWLETL